MDSKVSFTVEYADEKRIIYQAIRDFAKDRQDWLDTVLGEWSADNESDPDSSGRVHIPAKSTAELAMLLSQAAARRIGHKLIVHIESQAIDATAVLTAEASSYIRVKSDPALQAKMEVFQKSVSLMHALIRELKAAP